MSPDGGDIQAELTDWMVCQRRGRFLAFPVCGVWFNLQDLHFFSPYFVDVCIKEHKYNLTQGLLEKLK
jgi:hypothetical protein